MALYGAFGGDVSEKTADVTIKFTFF